MTTRSTIPAQRFSLRAAGPPGASVRISKASNADGFDEFGSSVAISSDGRTMVVGARMESSGARTVNGNQNDNDAG
jgi:hypothetical protein